MDIAEKDASNTKLVTEIIKNIGKKLITFKFIDLLKFSRPAKLTCPVTLQESSLS